MRIRSFGRTHVGRHRRANEDAFFRDDELCLYVVADGQALMAILHALGLTVCFRYEKYREEFALEDVVIAIDETPVGVFVEIEGSETHIASTAAALGRTAEDYIVDSYRALFVAHRQRHGAPSPDMVFPDTAGA